MWPNRYCTGNVKNDNFSVFIPHSQSVGYTYTPLTECGVYWNTLVRPSVVPSPYLVYATSHLSFGGFYSYLVCWSGMMWTCAYYTDFMVVWFLPEIWPFLKKIESTSYVRNYSFIILWILFIFDILVEHDMSMRILYRFHGWLSFAGFMALYDIK